MGQIWAAVIAGVVALVAVAMNARSDNMKKAERLTAISTAMSQSTERRLIEELRDDYVTNWALRQMAPAQQTLKWFTVIAYVAAVLSTLIWGFFAIVDPAASGPWLFYVLGIVLGGIGGGLQGRRRAGRNRWTREERGRRWMRQPLHARIKASSWT